MSGRARLVVFFGTLAVYVAALAPDMGWLDSSELAAAAWGLGIAHPPGHPLAVLLGKACALLPFGSIAFKVGLASALAGAGAAAQTTALGVLIARRTRLALAGAREPGGAGQTAGTSQPGARHVAPVDELAGIAAGLAFALCYAAALQAVRPEVYALHALLVTTAALELARWDESGDRRRLYLGALATGLALSNHTLLALAFAAAALVFVLWRRAGTNIRVAAARVLVAGALGFVLWAVLPVRARAHPLVDWGAPDSAERFLWVVTARAFQKALARATTGDATEVVWAVAVELRGLGLLLGLGGLWVLVRTPALRRLGVFVGLAAALDASAPAAVGFDSANPDAYGYLAPSLAFLAVSGAALVGALSHLRPRVATWVAASLALLAALGGALAWPHFARSNTWDARALLTPFLDETLPRAPLVSSGFQTIFGLYYLRAAEGRRPDVTLLHRHFLAYPGYRDELVRAAPETARFAGARDVDPEALPPEARVEYDLDLPDRLAARARVIRVPEGADARDPETRRFLAWEAFLLAHRACRTGEDPTRALALARARLGGDPELVKLAARCRQNL